MVLVIFLGKYMPDIFLIISQYVLTREKAPFPAHMAHGTQANASPLPLTQPRRQRAVPHPTPTRAFSTTFISFQKEVGFFFRCF